MQAATKSFLNTILKTISPSGSEEEALGVWGKAIAPYVDEVYYDVLGNLVAVKKGHTDKKLMFVAHADEVGFMLNYIDDKGYLYFRKIGGIDVNLLPGQKIAINGLNGLVYGVIGKKPIHLQSKDENKHSFDIEDLWIDIGVKSKSEAEQLVGVGNSAAFNVGITEHGTRISSKALDDRVGLASMIEAAQILANEPLDAALYFVASVQEELGSRGARTVVMGIQPDVCIAIDVTHATDYPTMSPIKYGNIEMGAGVVITAGPNINKILTDLLLNLVDKAAIAYQIEAISHPTDTDANPIQVAGQGIVTGLLSIPCRYMHTPVEMVDLKDVEATAMLIVEMAMLSADKINFQKVFKPE
ncbi:MAG: M20/M25/M40 family metallo-hydrolase [Prevotellaceae bacterium]|jgi:endoglucanase|nr:M20/M25/M40 family metallo-hydrolase [Prevotellaceae bacterium]